MPASVTDFAALGKMLEEHRPRLLAMLRRRIDTAPIDPEDILQEASVLAVKRWPRFKEQDRLSPYAWLYRLALDCLIEEWRRRGRHGSDAVMPLPEHSSILLGLGLVNVGTSPSAAVAREECRRHMAEALALLEQGDRDILWMKHFDDLKFREAAAILEITPNTAAVRYVRALERLRKLWLQLHGSSEGS
jgi:RNA polymerase sigma-70 factor (ECF subfamily)